MVKTNRHFGSLLISFAMLAACQAQQKPQDEAVASAPTSEAQEMSEGVVGPDEPFFAEYYLEQVFRYSGENSNPSLESGAVLAVAPATVNAFDFKANYTDSRIQLMVRSLYMQGDADGDGALSDAEFATLKLDPNLLGVTADRFGHSFDSALFVRIAGDDEVLQADECAGFLRDIGPAVKAAWDKTSAQDQRRALVKSWDKVLGRYDADQDGSLSLAEQRELRKDRASLVTRLTGE